MVKRAKTPDETHRKRAPGAGGVRPGAGRKPAGAGGVRVKDYPGLMLRLPVPTLARLKAVSKVRGIPIWRCVDEAVNAYVDALRGRDAEDTRRMAAREAGSLRAKHPSAG